MLLTYIEQDAEETRKLAYGVVIANLALVAVSRSLALDPCPAWAPVTGTIDIATHPDDGTSAGELLQAADARLYDGKRAGGDRVVVRESARN